MKIEEKRCSACSKQHLVCPECGGHNVTPHEGDDSEGRTAIHLEEWAMEADHGDTLTLWDTCWSCPWTRKITLTVSEK